MMKPSDSPQWRKQWKIEHHQGKRRILGPEKAQAHVQALVQNHGVTLRGIAEVAGISAFIVSDLNRGLKQFVHRDTEKAILAVTAETVLSRSNAIGLVPNVGGRRRIQALMAMGWRHQDLTPMLGMNTSNIIHQQGDWFTKRKHDAIKNLYDRLWDKRGPATALSINRVIKAGYAPPLAWDDETIDDPRAQPNLGLTKPKRGRPAKGPVQATEDQLEDVEFLLEQAYRWDAITDRLGVEPDSLERMLYRKGRNDLVTKAKNMDHRRDYAKAS